MKFHPAQSQIASDTTRFRVVLCGRRFGKTTLAVYEMVGKAVGRKDRKIAYVAPNYQQARDIAWQELKRITFPIQESVNEARLEVTIRTKDGGKSSIFLRGWESIDTLRGQRFDFLVLDEVASYRNFLIGWQEVLRPTLTDTKGEGLFIGTPKGFNHFYDLYNQKDSDYKSFHFTSYDNPYLPKEEIDKAKEELTEDRFAQEYLADFRKTEGLVYREFDRKRHVKEETQIGSEEVIEGIDFGYTNPSAVLKIVKNADRFHVKEEWYKTKQTTEQIAQAAVSFNPQRVYADPAEPDRIQQLSDKGLFMADVSKDIAAGVDKVHELLKQGRLTVDPSCENLIYEFETYAYPEAKNERNPDEKPIKSNDHALDALRYAVYADDSEQHTNNYKTRY